MMIRAILLAVVALLLSPAPHAMAHSASSSYLHIEVRDETLAVQWSIALRDLDYAIGLDSDGDGAITWGELRRKREAVEAYALTRLTLRADGGFLGLGRVAQRQFRQYRLRHYRNFRRKLDRFGCALSGEGL